MTNLADSANQNFPHTYDASNRLTARSAPNGVSTNYAYDGLSRLTALTHLAGATTLIGNQYTYSEANNINSWTNASGNHAYGYDLVDRLTAATNSAQPNENYSYDGVGNRTTSHLSASYSYQPFNKLTNTSTASYSYDNNGNLLSKTDSLGTTNFSWNEENQLTQVSVPNGVTVNYKYDGLGRRIQRTTSAGASERYVYDGPDVLLDLNADWSVATTYLSDLGIDNKLRQTSSATGVSYYLTDHLGSTAGLTDVAGNVVEQLTYDSFGNSAGSALTRYGYTGREHDPDTSLTFYRSRWYDPHVGRFISEDSIGLAGGNNLYGYVSNNPIVWKDPFGLSPSDPQACGCTCTIEVLAARITRKTLVGFHIFITTTDSCTGKTNAYRAGPGDNNKIDAISLPLPNSYFPDQKEDANVVVSLKIPGSCERWDESFTDTTNDTNRSQIDYSRTRNNSNAFAYTALDRAGVRPYGITEALNRAIGSFGTAPGWGLLLPLRTNLPPLRKP